MKSRFAICILLFTAHSIVLTKDLIRANFIKDMIESSNDLSRDDIAINAELQFRQQFKWTGKQLTKPDQQWIQQYARRAAIFQGQLEVLSIAELDTKIGTPTKKQNARFRILFHNPNNPKETDIRGIQADPQNKGKNVQLASTFSAQEGGIADPDKPMWDMLWRPVQGENARISAPGGAFFIKYFYPPINLLENLSDRIEVKHGNIQETFKGKTWDENDIKKIKVALHKNVAVLSGYGAFTKAHDDYSTIADTQERLDLSHNADGSIDINKSQVINQIITSAYSTRFARDKGWIGKKPEHEIEKMTKIILKGAYEGTFKAAYYSGNPHVFLTLVGGGAFMNNIEWIYDAIARMKQFIIDAGLQVTLIYYPERKSPPRKYPVRSEATDINFLKNITQLAAEINGTNYNPQALDQKISSYVNAGFAVAGNWGTTAQDLQATWDKMVLPGLTTQQMSPIMSSSSQAQQQIQQSESNQSLVYALNNLKKELEDLAGTIQYFHSH